MRHKTTVIVTEFDDIQVANPVGQDYVVIRVRYGKAREEESRFDEGVFELVVNRQLARKVFDKACEWADNPPTLVGPSGEPVVS